MDKMDIAKGLIFRGLRINKKESLEDRIMIQKKVYLLQQRGIDLGYEYNWYLKGPYSPTLTKYIYDKLDLLDSIGDTISLNKKVIKEIDEVNNLKDDRPSDLDEVSWYELLASILYVYNENYMWHIEKSKDKILEVLRLEKPKYLKKQSQIAYDKLIEHGYIVN